MKQISFLPTNMRLKSSSKCKISYIMRANDGALDATLENVSTTKAALSVRRGYLTKCYKNILKEGCSRVRK